MKTFRILCENSIKLQTTITLLLVILITSCSSDDESTPNPNQVPNDFLVTATSATKGLAINLNWEAATDPDGDIITYDVYIGTTPIAENLTGLTHSFEAPAYNTGVTGSVVAKDPLGAEQSVTFTATSSSLVDIPDTNFEQALINFGTDTDNTVNGQISLQDVLATTFLSMNNAGISDLTGIEAFTNLTSLSCFQNSLSTLDVSKNTSLTALTCANNNLSTLNIQNGNNLNFLTFDAQGNSNLSTVCVDVVPLPTLIQNGVDAGVTFTVTCN